MPNIQNVGGFKITYTSVNTSPSICSRLIRDSYGYGYGYALTIDWLKKRIEETCAKSRGRIQGCRVGTDLFDLHWVEQLQKNHKIL